MKFRYKGVVMSGGALRIAIIIEKGLDPAMVGEWIIKDSEFQILGLIGRPIIWHRQFTTDGRGVHNLREGDDT